MGAATAATPVVAQTDAVVVEAAPVYLYPTTQRTPLQTLPVNTVVRVLAEEGDWFRVEFPDSRFGPRVGYVEKKRVRLSRVQEQPITPPPAKPPRQPPPPEQPRPEPKAVPAQSRLGGRAYGTYSGTRFAASDTLEAVGSDSILGNFGGGGTVTGLWRGLFVDVGFSQVKTDGERVFIDDDGTVFPLGIALQVRVQSDRLGWRLARHNRPSIVVLRRRGHVNLVQRDERVVRPRG